LDSDDLVMNPCIVYLDTTHWDITHNPVKWLGKSVTAFLDWFIARREIESILVVPYRLQNGKFTTRLRSEYISFRSQAKRQKELSYTPPAEAFITVLNWAMDNDPIYSENHWLKGKIKSIDNPELLSGINYNHENFAVFFNLLPPDVILTGEKARVWNDKNKRLASSCKDTIIFDKFGTTNSVDSLYWDSLPEFEKLSRLFG